MPSTAHPGTRDIESSLRAVDAERVQRSNDPSLARRVLALKAWQEQRFRRTYADLLVSARYAPAARFFLTELYGPRDFTRRDAEFARIVPAIGRLFPADVVRTVASMTALHALSENLDTAMGRAWSEAGVNGVEGLGGVKGEGGTGAVPGSADSGGLDDSMYGEAWRRVGRAADRQRQIELMLEVGRAIDGYTRVPMLAASLRLMRGPARAAGLRDLHGVLEAGFDSFRAMGRADEFLSTVAQRETAVARRLFAGEGLSDVATP